ncbi:MULTISPECIES: hypothetical protein [unclassified Cryobacterium]|uniref:hypothetical protein n=1 Tax=unclassified Cryobacterium TaxID=2649013 RepID=UPI00106CCBF3|nr:MULTISPECIES: hypothetical protein [unclassified Cryobacterium]TFD09059.1 hypothetical protein E3T29_02440 [Cryobacterium sp. TMT1-66-1]TFD21536.1 hypothetical protein E3T31_12180 [Cryobacterium sp. TMS1-13-1]
MVDVENQDESPLRRLPSTPGASGPAELVGGDVQSISRALLLLTTTAEKITVETANNAPPAGSAAHLLWRGSEAGHAIDGLITMQYANMSAMDHARGFVSLIRTPTVRSTALATVARGSLESLARTWHLLARDSESDFIYRTISLLRSDLRFAELLGEPIRTRDGDTVDPAANRRFYADELKRLQLPSPARVALAEMVAAMLNAAMDKSDGRMQYSALSSIAHAHRLGINQFITTGSNGDVNGMAAPRPVVMQIVGTLTAATYGTVQAFVAFYGNQTRHVELLEKAMRRAVQTLNPIMDGIWPE